jgi:hypothetical protein
MMISRGNRRTRRKTCSDCNNYSGTSLPTAAYKVYAVLVTGRKTPLTGEQCEFRKGRSWTHCSATVDEKIRPEKNLDTHILLIDYVKAFDVVRRSTSWRNVIYPALLLQVIRSLMKVQPSELTRKH